MGSWYIVIANSYLNYWNDICVARLMINPL